MSADVAQILPGLVRFSTPFPHDTRRTVNSFVLSAGQEALLVDAAWNVPAARDGLEAALALSGLGLQAVRTVVITHLHPDHRGLATQLRQGGARIGFHPAEILEIRGRVRRRSDSTTHSMLWERLNGYEGIEAAPPSSITSANDGFDEPIEPDLLLQGDETLTLGDFRLRPIWTPGHTLGHLCYFEETRGLLFTGDHVLPTISPHVGLYLYSTGNPLPDYLASLNRLRSYHPNLVLPAHGEVFTDLQARLTELLEHHHERMEEMRRIIGEEPLSAWEVARQAHWTRRKVTLDQLNPWHRRLALAETIAHLELLRAENHLGKTFTPGQILYRRAPAP